MSKLPRKTKAAAATPRLPVTQAAYKELQALDNIAHLMDSRFRIPGTGLRFGLDSIAGLVPGIGDSATALVGAYLIWRAARLGASRTVLMRMAANTGIDWAVGSIPLLGDAFDLYFKSHRRNIVLLRAQLTDQLALDERASETSKLGGRARV